MPAGKYTARGSYGKAATKRKRIGGSVGRGAPFINNSEVMHRGQNFGKPKFSTDKSTHDAGGMIIQHQEYVQTVYGNDHILDKTPGPNFMQKKNYALAGAGEPIYKVNHFQSQTLDINPGLANAFPMLAQFATNFENYEMLQCVFHFETLLDEGVFQSSSGQVGDVLLYSHLNCDSTDLASASEFIQAGGSISRATKGAACGVECSTKQLKGLPNEGINKLRTGPVNTLAGTAANEEYDQAKFQFAVSNTPVTLASLPIGRLYVSYTCRLIKPRLSTILGRGQLRDLFSTWDSGAKVEYGDQIHLWPQQITGAYKTAAGGDMEKGTGWYRNRKNSIGCKLAVLNATNATSQTDVVPGLPRAGKPVNANRDRVKITFPDWFQGTVEVDVRFKIKSRSGAAGEGVATSFIGEVPTQALDFVETYGQVEPHYGLHHYVGKGESANSSWFETGMGAGGAEFNGLPLAGDNAAKERALEAKTIEGWATIQLKVSLPHKVSQIDNHIVLTCKNTLVHGKAPSRGAGNDHEPTADMWVDQFAEIQIRTIQDFNYKAGHHITQGDSLVPESLAGVEVFKPETFHYTENTSNFGLT